MDFDASNTPDFGAFVTRITDGTDDFFWHCEISLTASDGLTVPSSCGAGFESGYLGSASDLDSFRIDLVRLFVNEVDVSQSDPDMFGNTQNFATWDIVWQIIGGPVDADPGGP